MGAAAIVSTDTSLGGGIVFGASEEGVPEVWQYCPCECIIEMLYALPRHPQIF
jgi:hypothetical protein